MINNIESKSKGTYLALRCRGALPHSLKLRPFREQLGRAVIDRVARPKTTKLPRSLLGWFGAVSFLMSGLATIEAQSKLGRFGRALLLPFTGGGRLALPLHKIMNELPERAPSRQPTLPSPFFPLPFPSAT